MTRIVLSARRAPLPAFAAFALLAMLALPVGAQDFERFFGEFEGQAISETNGELSPRDIHVAIKRAGKGFNVEWATVIFKADGRVKRAEFAIDFRPTRREGIFRSAMRTNLFGPVRVAEAFADAVAGSELKKMVFISSKVGSIADNSSGGGYIYRSSKTALNMAVTSLSIDLSGKGIISLLLHPGWVQTDMGGPSGLVDAPTSVAGMRTVIDRATAAENGRFFNYDGNPLPW